MRLSLMGFQWLDVRWWWEEPPAGTPVHLRDPLAARSFLHRLAAEPAHLAALRRFVAAGAPPLSAPPEDGQVLDQLARAVAAGRVRLTALQATPHASWGKMVEEEPATPAAQPARAPAPEQEDVCWPCLQRAAASAQTLREAAANGVPFIAAG
ncbi:hypothetical protein [Sorangium sp. So ce131]|uniref:hypothetical protein n=1 Tax=Sorangium sp. So ce131 TaxID=3133282 RepID=UPI003F5E1E28